jgi:hypothetical protein
MSADDFQLMFNKWDKEVTQLMLGSEKCCNKFWNGSIKFSLVTGIWIQCLQAYRWIQQFHENKVAHRGNLFQTCRHLNIFSPLVLTPAQVILNINEWMTQLDNLKKDAPKLRNFHLREALAQAREDTASVIAIQMTLCAEPIRCWWRSVQQTVNTNRGGTVTQLKVSHTAGDILYAMREGVESQGAVAIKTQYNVAWEASILQDTCHHDNFRYLANTDSTDQVSKG